MKIGRFIRKEKVFYGLVDDDAVYPVESEPYGAKMLQPGSIVYPLAELSILAPCVPTKAVCTGLNYRKHAKELKFQEPSEPVIFLKPASAVIGPNDCIVLPEISKRVDYEAELAVIIGQVCKNVEPDKAGNYIFGYTCANDVTARDLQAHDIQWTRAKSFDTFLPLGPYITSGLNPDNLEICLYLNGKIKQQSSTRFLIFNVAQLISFISRIMTLNPGDVVLTGTPEGVGPLSKGDKVEVEIEGVGRLVNYVK